jgi:hypothetical protein
MEQEALAISASIDASELGKDYPEGKVLQRSASWAKMLEHQALFDEFAKLKLEWKRPDPNKKSAKERRAE